MTPDLQTLQHNAEQFIRDCEPLHYEMGHAQKFIVWGTVSFCTRNK